MEIDLPATQPEYEIPLPEPFVPRDDHASSQSSSSMDSESSEHVEEAVGSSAVPDGRVTRSKTQHRRAVNKRGAQPSAWAPFQRSQTYQLIKAGDVTATGAATLAGIEKLRQLFPKNSPAAKDFEKYISSVKRVEELIHSYTSHSPLVEVNDSAYVDIPNIGNDQVRAAAAWERALRQGEAQLRMRMKQIGNDLITISKNSSAPKRGKSSKKQSK